MRIAYFVDGFPLVSETFVLAQVAGMIQRGHDVTIFANRIVEQRVRHPLLERYNLMDKVIVRPMVPENRLLRLHRGFATLLTGAAAGRIGRALATLNIFRFGLGALGMNLLIRAGAHFRQGDFDVLHCQFGQLGIEVAKLCNCGVLSGSLVTSFRGADATITGFQRGNKFANLFATGDRFLAVSDSIRENLLELGCPADKIEVLRSGVDLSTFSYRGRTELHSPLRLVTIGRMSPSKGIEYSLDAVRDLVNEGFSISYRIIGNGPSRQDLIDYAAELDLGSVVSFENAVDVNKVAEILRDSDILVAPSIVASNGQTEGIPNVIKEAMASGVPAIGTDVGGVAELIDHGKNGFLVRQKDSDAIVDCVRTILAQQDEMPQILSRARQSIEQVYDLQRLNADLEKTYERAGSPC